MKTQKLAFAALCIAALLLAPAALASTGGGGVNNVAPTVTSGLTGNKGTQNNLAAATETFTFTVRDNNGEADFASIEIRSTDTTFGTRTCNDVSPSPVGCSGWSFTDSTPNDGTLTGSFVYTWPTGQTAGTFTQTLCIKDEGSFVCGSTVDQTTFTDAANINVYGGSTYDGNGNVDGSNWGQWNANPGAANVECENFLKAVNSGTGSGSVTVSFSSTAFTGGGGSIAIDNNMQFGYNLASTPNSGSFTWGPTDNDGAITYTMAAGETRWICYRIVAVPTPAPDAQYTGTYTYT